MSQLEDVLQQCTVKITLRGGWGTGFFVAPDLVLTCAHVVRSAGNQPIQVAWQQTELQATVEQSIESHDLALLRVILPRDAQSLCVYLDAEIQSRDPLYLFGYPDEGDRQGEPRTFNCDGVTGSGGILLNLGQVRPGMSGAALLNQRTGKVCGVVKFTRDRSIDLGGGAIPTRVVLEQFPQLRDLQQQFHQQDRRWIELLAAGANLDDLLAQIEAGAITSADLQRLREVLASGSSQLSQLGKYNINVGQGQDIHIGDRTYVEIDEAAVAAIVAAIQQSVSATYLPPPPAVSSIKEAKSMPPANAIFISYRRSDSHDVTGRIYDRLSEHFGREVVFKDVDSIPYGVDFRTHIKQAVGKCGVLIAVIGSSWLNALDDEGKRRVDDPDDWVRVEIEAALGREIPVIPLLVGGSRLPKADELPEILQQLTYQNAAQARPDPDFHGDLDRLICRLEEIVGSDGGVAERSLHDAPKPSKLSRFQQLELERLKEELDTYVRDHNSVSGQLKLEGDTPRQNQLQDQLKMIGQKMEKLEQQIQELEQ